MYSEQAGAEPSSLVRTHERRLEFFILHIAYVSPTTLFILHGRVKRVRLSFILPFPHTYSPYSNKIVYLGI
jgi:hypothetical protein